MTILKQTNLSIADLRSELGDKQMSKTQKNEWNLNQHIEQECIQGSYDRLFPVINQARECIDKAGSVDAKRYAIDQLLQLEEHALELAKFALDYFTQSKS